MRRPDLHLPMSLGRALAELAIIVAGVLIALGAQAWWEDRSLDEDRERTIRLLDEDLARLESTLRDTLDAVEVDTIIHGLLGLRPPEPDRDLSWAIRQALWSYGFQIGAREGEELLPAYADLKNSGRLALLPDTVRATMPEVELQLTRLSRFLDDYVYHQQTRVDAILFERFELVRNPNDADDGTVMVADAERYQDVFSDREVRNRLLLKSQLIHGQLRIWRETADLVASVRGLIATTREPE